MKPTAVYGLLSETTIVAERRGLQLPVAEVRAGADQAVQTVVTEGLAEAAQRVAARAEVAQRVEAEGQVLAVVLQGAGDGARAQLRQITGGGLVDLDG